ncbi:MAG: choice-of-anchor tandem repeat GloVer-containing protein [Puniceicoccaceae bacterium]
MRWLAIPVLLCSLQVTTARDVAGLFEDALLDTGPDQVIAYKTVGNTDLSLHVFEPLPEDNTRRSCIVWIHGGGWENGNPQQLYPHAAYFARLGYTAISIEYRLAGDSSTIFDCVEDVRDAFYWIHENAESLGVDANKIIVGGESAGGHLAGCIGYIEDPRSSGIPVPQPYPAATILVNPITLLTSISWAMTKPGLTPSDVALAESISPLLHIDSNDPPALLLHGDADSVVPPDQSSDFAEAVRLLGNPAKLRLWEGKSHAFFLYLPEFSLEDKPVIHLSLLEIEAFLQIFKLNGYPEIHGHFSPVHLFEGSDGFRSFSELIETGGKLYGSTYKGGPDDAGTVFCFNPSTLKLTTLHAFDGVDGREVFNGLATDGTTLYGVTKFGGSDDRGTLFKVDLDGTNFQTLHEFTLASGTGWAPHSAPILMDGALYGTTYHGGSTGFGGALYKFPLPTGPIELLHSFTVDTGRHPTGQLLPVGDWLYGTASDFFEHGSDNFGSLYRINKDSHVFELLHSFDGAGESGHPYDDLYWDGGDTFIGTTFGEVFTANSMGNIFAYSTSTGELDILHDFGLNPGTGSKPNGALISIDASGALYGVAHGSNGTGGEAGTLFSMMEDGTDFTVFHRFTSGLQGNTPMRRLLYHQGSFYGISVFGGLTSDTSDPEVGPGFIFRYTPAASLSTQHDAFVAWLREYFLVVNQDPDTDLDGDGWSLIEEFVFGGSPLEGDPGQPFSLSVETGTGLVARFNRVASVMENALNPYSGSDLQNWASDGLHAVNWTDHPTDGPEFKSVEFSWTLDSLQSGPLFLQFETALP